MDKQKNKGAIHYKKWFWKAALGLMLTGAGLCFFGEAVCLKNLYAAPLWKWVILGSWSLIVFQSGLCLVISAGIHRSHYERINEVTEDE